MLSGPRVTLRAFTHSDIERYSGFRNDLEVELLAGFSRPYPRAPGNFEARLDKHTAAADPDEIWLAIEVDATLIGEVQLRRLDPETRTWELGISIGDRRTGPGRTDARRSISFWTTHSACETCTRCG